MKRTSLAAAFILVAVGALAGPQTRARGAAPVAKKGAKLAPQRAKLLKANLDSFALHLSYLAVKKEQSAGASFSTWKGPGPAPKGHPAGGVRISKAQAAAIIDHLDKSGVLSRLLDPRTLALMDMHIPTPHLHVRVIAGKHSFQNWLPIDPKAVELLEALGKLLDGDAAKAMGKVTKALEPQRKMWLRQKAALFVKRLKASKRTLNLVLTYHPVGLKDRNTYPNLHLLWMAPAGVNLPSSMIVMSRREAMAAIDALAKAGYFERAGDITARRAMRTAIPWPEHKGPCYSLIVSSDNLDCHANLGWDLKMLECLDTLRKAFGKGSDAAKAMDFFIKTIEPQRKEWEAQAQRDVKRREACLAALQEIRKGFPALVRKYPKGLGHLGPGALDEEKLFLRFPAKYLPKAAPAMRPTAGRSRPRLLQPKDCGMSFHFTTPMSPKANAGQWLHVNVGLVSWWMWPGGGFSTETYKDVQALVRRAVAPLDALEDAAVAAPRGKDAYVLRGRPGVKLTIRLSPKRSAFGTVVDLYVTNQTKQVVALCPPYLQVIRDGKPRHDHARSSLWLGLTHVLNGRKDPFTYIQPGRSAKIKSRVVALSPGKHTVRIAAGHLRDYWVDVRPTFLDGLPVRRKVPSAWTGVLVSGEMTIDIPTPAAANKKAAERAKLLNKTGTLYLVLQYHIGYIGAKPSLHLATTNYKIDVIGGTVASLTPKEVANIIDHLAKEGFLAQAENVVGKDITPPQGPAYTLTLMGAGQTRLYQVLGWDLKMLRRLEALRKVLAKGSNAAKGMDKVLKALDPQQKKWEKAAGSGRVDDAWVRAKIQRVRLADIPLLIVALGSGDAAMRANVHAVLARWTGEKIPHTGNAKADKAAWEKWWNWRPGKGMLSRAEIPARIRQPVQPGDTSHAATPKYYAKAQIGVLRPPRPGDKGGKIHTDRKTFQRVWAVPWVTDPHRHQGGGGHIVLDAATGKILVQSAYGVKDSAKPAVRWGAAVAGLVCGISAFNPKVQLGVPYEIEVSIKNISKGDILLLKRRFFNKEPLSDHVYFMRGGTTYREFFTHLEKLLAIGLVRREDFVLLKPNVIYKFTHRTLVYTPSMRKNLKRIEAGMGPMPLTQEGTYLMHVAYGSSFRLAKGADLGDLKPWKGVLLSAPVEVVVGKAPAKKKAS